MRTKILLHHGKCRTVLEFGQYYKINNINANVSAVWPSSECVIYIQDIKEGRSHGHSRSEVPYISRHLFLTF